MYYLSEVFEDFEKTHPELFPENNENVIDVHFGESFYIHLKEDQVIPITHFREFKIEKIVEGEENEEVGDFDPISGVFEPASV